MVSAKTKSLLEHSSIGSSSSAMSAWLLNGLVPAGYLPGVPISSKSDLAISSRLLARMFLVMRSLVRFTYFVIACFTSSGTFGLWPGFAAAVVASATAFTTSAMELDPWAWLTGSGCQIAGAAGSSQSLNRRFALVFVSFVQQLQWVSATKLSVDLLICISCLSRRLLVQISSCCRLMIHSSSLWNLGVKPPALGVLKQLHSSLVQLPVEARFPSDLLHCRFHLTFLRK